MLNDRGCSIDHPITADVLEHVRRDYLVFREIRRMLEPGGVSVGTIRLERERPR
jgi:hypothetical protein